MRNSVLALATVVALAAAGATSAAEAGGDAAAGRVIAARYCAACHEIPGLDGRAAPAPLTPPAFAAIAAHPETYTRARLERFLRAPHFPMKTLVLSRHDIANLIAFIESLRAL